MTTQSEHAPAPAERMRAAAVVISAYQREMGEARDVTDARRARLEAIRLVRERGLPVRAVDDSASPGWPQRAGDLAAYAAAGGSVDVVLRGGIDAVADPGRALLARAGVAVRITSDPGVRVVMAGAEVAWVGIGSVQEGRFARVQARSAVVALGCLYDRLRTSAVATADPVLAALAFGMSDERAATAMGVSCRTFTRRVRGLMDQLGVRTRFELACSARHRGWL